MSKWISDRLPLCTGNYQTYRPSAPSGSRVGSLWFDSWHNGWSGKYKVTDWMPLPAPPKSVK
jgi:hypothetical protein